MRKHPSDKQLAAWYDEIERSGHKRLKIRALLKCFGLKRRGSLSGHLNAGQSQQRGPGHTCLLPPRNCRIGHRTTSLTEHRGSMLSVRWCGPA